MTHLIFCEEREGLEAEELESRSADLARLAEQPNPGVKIRAKGESRWLWHEASALSAFLPRYGGVAGRTAAATQSTLPRTRRTNSKKLLPGLRACLSARPRRGCGAQLFLGLVDRKHSIIAAYVYQRNTCVGSPRETCSMG